MNQSLCLRVPPAKSQRSLKHMVTSLWQRLPRKIRKCAVGVFVLVKKYSGKLFGVLVIILLSSNIKIACATSPPSSNYAGTEEVRVIKKTPEYMAMVGNPHNLSENSQTKEKKIDNDLVISNLKQTIQSNLKKLQIHPEAKELVDEEVARVFKNSKLAELKELSRRVNRSIENNPPPTLGEKIETSDRTQEEGTFKLILNYINRNIDKLEYNTLVKTQMKIEAKKVILNSNAKEQEEFTRNLRIWAELYQLKPEINKILAKEPHQIYSKPKKINKSESKIMSFPENIFENKPKLLLSNQQRTNTLEMDIIEDILSKLKESK